MKIRTAALFAPPIDTPGDADGQERFAANG
jgi:hypothetical protein